MNQQQTHRGEVSDPGAGPTDRLIHAWVRRELSDAYDRTLGETLPEELLSLAMMARPRH